MSSYSHPTVLRKHALLTQPDRAPPLPPNLQPTKVRSVSANPPTTNRLQRSDSPNRNQFAPRSASGGPHSTNYDGRPGSGSILSASSQYTYADSGRGVSSPMTPIETMNSDNESPADSAPKRRSWLGARRKSRIISQDLSGINGLIAWVNADDGSNPKDYSLHFLTTGEKVPELWDYDDVADTFIYLFPASSQFGPSFKVPSYILSSSQQLAGKINEGRPRARSFDGRASLAVEDALRTLTVRDSPPLSQYIPDSATVSDGSDQSIKSLQESKKDIQLYFPLNLTTSEPKNLTEQDIQSLVEARNLFAYLTGQPLVSTPKCPSRFHILCSVAALLWKFEFTNHDGSSYGEAVSTSFDFYLDVLKLADVRESREKTLEGLILGERMRSTQLYKEAFAHAVGKYDSIREVNPRLFEQINSATRKKLERAFLDLCQRRESVTRRLTAFEFPSVFAGIASSAAPELKGINFKSWKANFLNMRKMVLAYYKHLHGQWPPKARSKKNEFVEGGLNRLVLVLLYNDMCSLYDLIVNHDELMFSSRIDDPRIRAEENTHVGALRKLLGEFDRSSPPVQPPIPFDVPIIPSMATSNPRYHGLSVAEQAKINKKKLKDAEGIDLLRKSRNVVSEQQTSFLQAFIAFEEKESRGKNCKELADQRYGHWIFLYTVIQTLPMLIIDAPGVRFTAGVEYFLCQPPMGGLPWVSDDQRGVYQIGDSEQIVVLSNDTVENSIDATYRRSHCWTMATKWIMGSEATNLPLSQSPELIRRDQPEPLSPLTPPPGFAGGELGLRPSSRALERSPNSSTSSLTIPSIDTQLKDEQSRDRYSRRRSMGPGLNKLPIPGGAAAIEWREGYNYSPSLAPGIAGGASRGTSPSGLNSPVSAGGNRRYSSRPDQSFDDILKDIPATPVSKKKSFFK